MFDCWNGKAKTLTAVGVGLASGEQAALATAEGLGTRI